jgi:hypothetical protein
MVFLEGDMEEIYYFYDEKQKKLEEGPKQIHKQGTVGFISDEVALHKVRPLNGSNHGVTMYIVSIDNQEYFDLFFFFTNKTKFFVHLSQCFPLTFVWNEISQKSQFLKLNNILQLTITKEQKY